MSETIYTAITFAPVQGFIEKSRKLRDLYGSSFLLSYLATAICKAAENEQHEVISPAQINVTQGTPNQIIIKGDFSQKSSKEALDTAWQEVTKTCRIWIETQLPNYTYYWQREWNAWTNYAWEFFWAQEKGTISDVRKALSEKKRKRDWTGINWKGESSTLSGGDAIAWYGMVNETHPLNSSLAEQQKLITGFYQQLSDKVGESILDHKERLSIPELIKRLITLDKIADQLKLIEKQLPNIELTPKFKDLNRQSNNSQENRYTGWFQGDGDSIGTFLQKQAKSGDEATSLNDFSFAMMNWGRDFKHYLPPLSDTLPKIRETRIPQPLSEKNGLIIYAGGDDFLGVLYNNYPEPALKPQECLDWFYRFDKEIWPLHNVEITVSVGFVWAAPGVPQRDVLQHCREAEKSAKKQGRDRLAIRILFNSGNHLEWVCPWWFLKDVLHGYKDRSNNDNWTHFYNDVAVLEARHAFTSSNSDLALGLFEIYFNPHNLQTLQDHLWDKDHATEIAANGDKKKITGILGNQPKTPHHQLLNEWIINLAKVGFHLYV